MGSVNKSGGQDAQTRLERQADLIPIPLPISKPICYSSAELLPLEGSVIQVQGVMAHWESVRTTRTSK
jgi:hypothetical protein